MAVPIQWTLSNVTFVGGATASGSFIYDADTNTYSAISIVSTGSGSIPGSTFVVKYPSANASFVCFMTGNPSDLTGQRIFILPVSGGPLSNAGGTRTLSSVNAEGTCTNAACTNATLNVRVLAAGGSIIGAPPVAPVPAPPTGAMALAGILVTAAALYAMRRRRADETLAG